MKVEVLSFARNNSLIAGYLDAIMGQLGPQITLHDSPMSFCKYVYIPAESIGYKGTSTLALIEGNETHLRSGYITRKNDGEVPYLDRWLDASKVTGAPVKCIAIILYSREQLSIEGMVIESDWGLVTAQAEPMMGVSPMTPATAIRNALGIRFGGNGTELDPNEYMKSVEFWSKWAILK